MNLTFVIICMHEVVSNVGTFILGCFLNEQCSSSTGYTIVGFAMYYFTYDPWIGKLLYLEDFFVMNELRGKFLITS